MDEQYEDIYNGLRCQVKECHLISTILFYSRGQGLLILLICPTLQLPRLRPGLCPLRVTNLLSPIQHRGGGLVGR